MAISRLLPKLDSSIISPHIDEAGELCIKRGLSYHEAFSFLCSQSRHDTPNIDDTNTLNSDVVADTPRPREQSCGENPYSSREAVTLTQTSLRSFLYRDGYDEKRN